MARARRHLAWSPPDGDRYSIYPLTGMIRARAVSRISLVCRWPSRISPAAGRSALGGVLGLGVAVDGGGIPFVTAFGRADVTLPQAFLATSGSSRPHGFRATPVTGRFHGFVRTSAAPEPSFSCSPGRCRRRCTSASTPATDHRK